MLTVGQLIKELQKQDPNLRVVVSQSTDYCDAMVPERGRMLLDYYKGWAGYGPHRRTWANEPASVPVLLINERAPWWLPQHPYCGMRGPFP